MKRSTPSLRSMYSRMLAALGATVAAGALIAAPTLAGTAHADGTKTLTIALTQEIDSLNPFQAYFSSSTQIGRLMYDFLTAYDAKDTHPIGGVADKWSYTKDKKTWTFHIADGHKWSDGKPVTAQDVAFTYNLIMTNEDAAKANGNFVTNFKSVVAKDDHTLVITTKAPQATMLALDIPIVPEHIWKGQSPKNYKPEDHLPAVGDGPFILTDYKAGQYVKFKANKDYWRGAPKIDQLVFQEFSNPDAAVQALQKGEVDLISGTNAAQTRALEKDKNITVNKAQGKR
ncbi:MAG TPA: ABC transporter substrate-binding protein, partial [Mycobacteriales bacterium]|nr:ABC transporter substrate-binding protein [Mycobacteriales bacterium]